MKRSRFGRHTHEGSWAKAGTAAAFALLALGCGSAVAPRSDAPAAATKDRTSSLPTLSADPVVDAIPVTVAIDDATVVNEVDGLFHGTNFCAFWNNTGDSPATMTAVSTLGAKIFRFPGGTVAHWHDWAHPPEPGHGDVWPDSTAWHMASSVDGALMLQTNCVQQSAVLDNSAEHQAGWVAFAKEHGYRVAWWEIGNEPEMDAPAPYHPAEDRIMAWYNAVYERQAKAIHAADPQARILGYSGTNVWFWWAQRGLEMFLAAHGDKEGTGLADGISLHWYCECGDKPWAQVRGAAQGWQGCWDYIQAAIQHYDSRDLPVHITEWNFAGGMGGMSLQTYSTALGNADMIGMMLRTGVKGQQYFCLQGPAQAGWGALTMKGTPRGDSAPNPTYFALAFASRLTGKVLATTCDVDEANVLSAYAAQSPDGTLHVMLINKGDRAATVALKYGGSSLAGREVAVNRLESPHDDPAAQDEIVNGVASPHPEQGAMPPPQRFRVGERCAITLRPVSMAVLSFTGLTPITATAQRRIVPAEKVQKLGIGKAKATEFKHRDPAAPALPVPYVATPPAFAADPQAWSAIPPLPAPFMKKDAGTVKLCWSEDGLHGLAVEQDSGIEANAKEPWKADAVEVFVEKDAAGNWDRSVASAQYVFCPNPKAADGIGLASTAYYTAADLAAPAASRWRQIDGGWALEFFIPRAALAPATMAEGTRLGFNLAVDLDGKCVEQYLSDKGADNGWNNPATWGVISLAK